MKPSTTPQAYLAIHLANELGKALKVHKQQEIIRVRKERAQRLKAMRVAKVNTNMLDSTRNSRESVINLHPMCNDAKDVHNPASASPHDPTPGRHARCTRPALSAHCDLPGEAGGVSGSLKEAH
jgi:hypothetical protein